jgi:uncharacterized protein with HEPN domain
MDNEVKTWLKDIEQAIIEINSFIPEIKNFKDFQKDLKTKRAVERNIEIIEDLTTQRTTWVLKSKLTLNK